MAALGSWRGRGKSREVEVVWAGFDADAQEPWETSWVPKQWLSVDLRALDPEIDRRAARKREREAAVTSRNALALQLRTRHCSRHDGKDPDPGG